MAEHEAIITLAAADIEHAQEIKAAMDRVNQVMIRIVAANPQTWYGLGKAIKNAEDMIPGVSYAEVEFASYLAGLSVRE